MNKPKIICHMVISIDDKVTGSFLTKKESENAINLYYEMNRECKVNGFICGRVTMEESFTHGYYPDLDEFKECDSYEDFILLSKENKYAVSYDRKGRVGWKEGVLKDEDPGYDGLQIIEVLTKGVDKRYLTYLREIGVSYIFAGIDDIDIIASLEKLKKLFNIETLLLEGGSIINGAFLKANAIDEVSLVVAPIKGEEIDKSLFNDGDLRDFEIIKRYNKNGVEVFEYRYKYSNFIEVLEFLKDRKTIIGQTKELSEDFHELIKNKNVENNIFSFKYCSSFLHPKIIKFLPYLLDLNEYQINNIINKSMRLVNDRGEYRLIDNNEKLFDEVYRLDALFIKRMELIKEDNSAIKLLNSFGLTVNDLFVNEFLVPSEIILSEDEKLIEIYRKINSRCNRSIKMIPLLPPELILINEKKLLYNSFIELVSYLEEIEKDYIM